MAVSVFNDRAQNGWNLGALLRLPTLSDHGTDVKGLRPFSRKVRTPMWNKLKKSTQIHDLQLDELWNKMKQRLETMAGQAQEKGSAVFVSILPFLHDKDLLKWTEGLTKSASTIYDKAMDAEYLKSHLGGGEHRLFDGGHTLSGSWEAVKDALPDDNFAQEVTAWTQSYLKDLTTTNDMPFFNLDKENFDG